MGETNNQFYRDLESTLYTGDALVSRVVPQVDLNAPEAATASFTYNFYTSGEMVPGMSAVEVQSPLNPNVGVGQTYVGTTSRKFFDISGTTIEKMSDYFNTQTQRFPMFNTVSWTQSSLDNLGSTLTES